MTKHQEIDLLIEADWIATVDTGEVLKNHAVAVDAGRIVALLPGADARRRFKAREHRQLPDHLLIPGLINLHTHAAMNLMRGLADDLPLMTWLQEHIWPAEAAHVSAPFVLDGSRLACAEMLLGGVTCFNDMYFFPEATAQAAVELGLRAHLGITALEFPTAWATDADDYLNKGLEVRERWLEQPLIRFCLAPHAPYTVSDRTFERVLTLSEQLGIPIHCHVHETAQEIADSLAQHGLRPLQRLARLGLLGPNFIGVHAVHLDDGDLDLLGKSGSHVAHCPTSNLKLASGIARVDAMHRHGIAVGLGTDGAASNNRLDLFGEMRLAALLAKGASGDAAALPATSVLRMATLDAAQALGMADEIGSISVGKAADLCAVSLAGLGSRPCYDPISHLVHVLGREAVSDVWVAGKARVRDGRLVWPGQADLLTAVGLWQNKLETRP